MPAGVKKIGDFPTVTFKIGTGETKTDREWLKKKKESYEKDWIKNGLKILKKIEETCGNTFPEMTKQEGIMIVLHKKMLDNQLEGILADDNPFEINLFLAKNDSPDTLKTLLVRMLVYSFVQQQYEFHFRMTEPTLFEDILTDELIAAKTGLIIMGRKLGRANCTKALDQAIQQTVYRLSKKQAQNTLIDMAYTFFQEQPANRKQKVDILTSREELIAKLLELLPKTAKSE
jgi:hypothetical protein